MCVPFSISENQSFPILFSNLPPMTVPVSALDHTAYVTHGLHRGDGDWAETNCYVDVWIEVLNALGFEPLAGLGFTMRIDLEADQWTFFKFAHDELFSLYGIEVFELNPWQSVVEQSRNEVQMGRIPLVEVDAFYLPDTAGTTYRNTHGKTTIGIARINTEGHRLTYFHNGGFFMAEADDFVGLFPTAGTPGHVLPPYIEVVKPGSGEALTGERLLDEAVRLARRTVKRMPPVNPFVRFAERFPDELAVLHDTRGAHFHEYAFANFRQFGAAFFLAGRHLGWLRSTGFIPSDVDAFESVERSFATISSTAKTLQFQAARSAIAGKMIDASAPLGQLISAWDEGVSSLHRVFD